MKLSGTTPPAVQVLPPMIRLRLADLLQSRVGGVQNARVAPRPAALTGREPATGRSSEGPEALRLGGLAPDHPVAHARVAPRGRGRKLSEVVRIPRRPFGRPAAVRPARSAREEYRHSNPPPAPSADRLVYLGGPSIGGVGRVSRVGRAHRRCGGPAETHLIDAHTESLVGRELGHAADFERAPDRLVRSGACRRAQDQQHARRQSRKSRCSPLHACLCHSRARALRIASASARLRGFRARARR